MLYIVPTPIGNIEDITLRSLNVLKNSEILIVEDSRVTSKLFSKLEISIKPKMINIVAHNIFNIKKVTEALELLKKGNISSITLVSDAGTPCLSDPGFEVIKLAQQMEIPYTVLPGANAVVPAVVASGLVGGEFRYLGFLPLKKGRQTLINSFMGLEIPVVFYESVHRIHKTLTSLKTTLEAERKIFIGRELTKQYEEYTNTTLGNLDIEKVVEKGEFVIVLDKKFVKSK
jgi:16S rRNA (cytidine1402-2'-O)-methyltransferase